MLPNNLDQLFPYVCFSYGVLITFTLNVPALVRIADERIPLELLAQMRGHRVLAMASMWIGALWILQNLWLT
jgi:hypothetical protein